MYWVDHVLKHRGASHLQNAGVKLNSFEAYLLDVLSFLIGISILLLYVNFVIIKKILVCIRKTIEPGEKIKIN